MSVRSSFISFLGENVANPQVASKSVFVITVKLLDSAVLECTLSAESTGRSLLFNLV